MRPLPEPSAREAAGGAAPKEPAIADLTLARRIEEWLQNLPCPQDERALRRQLFRQAAAAGLPDSREESWRYADLKGLALADFFPSLASAGEAGEGQADPWPALRFHEGCLAGSAFSSEDEGLMAWSLAQGCPADLSGQPAQADDSIWQLARAFATHGSRITVAAGRNWRLELASTAETGPVHGLHHLTVAQDGDLTLLIRTKGGAAAGSERLQLHLEAGARARILLLQDTAAGAHHFLRLDAEIGAGAELLLVQAMTGPGYARAEHHWRLAGPEGCGQLALLALPYRRGHADVLTRFRHHDCRTRSHQTVRMLAARRDQAAYQGLVHVAQGADGTDSRQDAKGLLLARGGEIDLKPELEIFADDVACAHGATVGQLDPAALFYLMARGIPEAEARRMLIAAFTDAVLQAWPQEDLFSGRMEETVLPALAALSMADGGEAE